MAHVAMTPHIETDLGFTYYVLDVEQRRAMRRWYDSGQCNAPEDNATEEQRHVSGLNSVAEYLCSLFNCGVVESIVSDTVSYYGA